MATEPSYDAIVEDVDRLDSSSSLILAYREHRLLGQGGYSTLSRVSNEMGDHSQVYRFRFRPSDLGQLSLAIFSG